MFFHIYHTIHLIKNYHKKNMKHHKCKSFLFWFFEKIRKIISNEKHKVIWMFNAFQCNQYISAWVAYVLIILLKQQTNENTCYSHIQYTYIKFYLLRLHSTHVHIYFNVSTFADLLIRIIKHFLFYIFLFLLPLTQVFYAHKYKIYDWLAQPWWYKQRSQYRRYTRYNTFIQSLKLMGEPHKCET